MGIDESKPNASIVYSIRLVSA